MAHSAGVDWDVRVDDGTVVVELPRRLTLDEQGGEQLYDAFCEAVSRPDTDRVLTLVDVEHPLSARLHDVVSECSRIAAANGVTDWHIAAEHEIKAVAVEREIHGVETAVLETEREARAQLA